MKEQGEDIVFLRKIIQGGADKSYGIQVAKLAGVPEGVLHRAREIADMLASSDINTTAVLKDNSEKDSADTGASVQGSRKEAMRDMSVKKGVTGIKKRHTEPDGQLSLFDAPDYSELIEELRGLELANITPLDALNKLYAMQEKVKQLL